MKKTRVVFAPVVPRPGPRKRTVPPVWARAVAVSWVEVPPAGLRETTFAPAATVSVPIVSADPAKLPR